MSLENNNIDNKEQESILEDPMSEIRAIEMEGYEIGVKRARNAMFVIAGITLLYATYFYFQLNGFVNYLFWVLFVLPGVVFILLGIFSNRKPYLTVLLGFTIYLGVTVLNIILLGFAGLGGVLGIVLKTVIIFYLFNGLKDAKKLEEARKEMY